ncbi:PD-(D/E)XK nuclease family protein [Halomonas saccharevitans]|uniref:PD-(D/E)XK nuclease family protein n=1 Tax=Halomonas saccharevitans TaxID=416872 RepID=A0ABU3NKV0_9GAMM|nr:PD-(D/E)XK nuclease family protein [Halomonas saccharevitans]MDT8880912.1 PD-(D/E)XK nuclease family protein [Halomonas saccharevitans]
MLDDTLISDDLMDVVGQARERANQKGERFNIFSILKVHRDEAETHSRFLHELLNPRGRHGEGSAFLDLFLDGVLGISSQGGQHFRVRRELPTEEKRRVDMVIESPTDIIGVELKVDAADQKAQLHDYYHELQRRAEGQKTVTLAYLTLGGKRPSTMSLKELSEDDVVCLSFAHHITGWLQKCIDQSQHKPELAHAIQQYLQLIRNLTGKGGTMNDLVAGELKGDMERFQEALEVEKSLPKAKASVQEVFWKELSDALTDEFGVTPTVYNASTIASMSKDYYSKNRSNKHIRLKFPVCQLDGKAIYLYTNLYHAVHYGLRVEDESGAVIAAQSLRDTFREKWGTGNAVADKDADWLACYYFNPKAGDAEKIINFDSFNTAAVGLLDDEVRRTLIEDMVAHQAELAEKAKELSSQ